MRLHRGPETRRGGSTRGAHSARLGAGIGERGTARLERGGPSVVRDQEVDSLAGLVSVGDDLAQGLAVLPDEVPQQLAASSHLREALGIVGDLVAQVAQLGRDVGRLGSSTCSRASSSANGVRPAITLARATASSAPPSPVRASTARAPASRWASRRQPVLLDLEPASSSASSRLGGVELVDLVAQEVDLSGPGSRVATERRRVASISATPAARLEQRRQVDLAELSSAARCSAAPAATGGRAVRAGRRGGAHLGQRADGRQPAVDVGA